MLFTAIAFMSIYGIVKGEFKELKTFIGNKDNKNETFLLRSEIGVNIIKESFQH